MSFAFLPNALSILRIILTVPVVITILNNQYFLAFFLFFLASITDLLDGLFARRFNIQTRIGSFIDPLADRILLISSFITLYFINLFPLWLLILVLLRDFIIMLGSIIFFVLGKINSNNLLFPKLVSKFSTFLQIVLVLFLLSTQAYNFNFLFINIFFIIVAIPIVLNGISYIMLIKLLIKNKNK